METKADVVVISAFGRGNWMAAELAGIGLETHLIDVSDLMGRWAPEDWEGPFGLFHSEFLSPSLMTRLHEEDYFDPVDEGFVVWLKDGPIDTLGPHAAYLLERKNVTKEQQEYLHKFDHLKGRNLHKLREEIARLPFRESWFVHLAHVLGSAVHYDNADALQAPRPLPVLSPLSIRRVTRRGYEKSLEWVRSRKVRVFEKAKLKDFSVNSRFFQSLEIESPEWSGVLIGEQVIWCLTSAETARLQKHFGEELFSGEALASEWSWVRYRYQLKNEGLLEVIPKKFVMIEDLELAWTHANMALVQKTVSEQDFDVWMKVPTQHRFHRGYLENLGEEMRTLLAGRIPRSEPKLVSMPQDYHYDESTLGPSRYPVYNRAQLKKLPRKAWINLHYDGPECWELLDWNGVYLHQQTILSAIKSWKEERDIRRAKLEAQMQTTSGDSE